MLGIRRLLRRKKPELEVSDTYAAGRIEIRGIGSVPVETMPDKIPTRMFVGGRWVKVDKEAYKYLWAITHATDEGRKKLESMI